MLRFLAFVFGLTVTLSCVAQIDTVMLSEESYLQFPFVPVKSSFTNLYDKNDPDVLYAAQMEFGLGIYDVSVAGTIDPIIELPVSVFHDLDVSTFTQVGDLLFVGIGDFQVTDNPASGLAILDVSNPSVPVVKDVWDSIVFQKGVSHLLVEGDYAYLSVMGDGLVILNIADASNISYVSSVLPDINYPAPSSGDHQARGLKLRNDSLYVCFDRGGLRLIDVSDKYAPVEVYKYINTTLNSNAGAAYNDVVLKDHYAFVSVDYCGLEVLDISTTPFVSVDWYNPWNCDFTNWSDAELHTNELKLVRNDSLLVVSGGQSEVFVFDVTEPLNVHKAGEFVYLGDTLATHGLDATNDHIALAIIHTPVHLPPFTPFYSKYGGIKILHFSMQTAGLKQQENAVSVTVYPNPASSLALVESSERITGLRIMDASGRSVVQLKGTVTQQQLIDLGLLEGGLYILHVTTENGMEQVQLVVE